MVFEERSGHTHQFAPLAAAVMACLEERARSLDEVAAAIASDLRTSPDHQLRAAVAAIVLQLRNLGWVETIERSA